MSNWSYLEDFARRFSLAETTTRPENRALFAANLEFAAALIDMVAELDARREHLGDFDPDQARDGLARSAQHLIEAIIAALAGLYASGNVIYRLSVESTLQAFYTEEEVFARQPKSRQEEIRARDWDIGAADYRRALKRTRRYAEATDRLYTVYRTLSRVAHGSLQLFEDLPRHLHSLPRFSPREAADLSDLMRVGNAAAGHLIRERFRSLFQAAHVERVASFDRAVQDLREAETSGHGNDLP